MEHLHLIIPDLILPREIAPDTQAELSLLEKMLARATHETLPASATEQRLCELFGVVSPAPLRAAGDGLEVADSAWMCADPVELQRQPAQVMVRPDVVCEAAEALAFCEMLNGHFAVDGISFHAPHPQRWYLQMAEVGEVMMPTLSSAAWGDARELMPQGRDAVRWRSLGNEVQMLLHGHVLNQKRLAAGLPPISSLWLWGGGHPGELSTMFGAAGGDEPLGAFARAAGLRRFDSLSDMLGSESEHGVWLTSNLLAPLRQHDLYQWRENLFVMQRDLLQVVWQALGAGKLRSLTLEVPTAEALHHFELKAGDRWKVWRHRQPLAVYSV
ncbi:MAG: hypothetical protein KJ850_09750 [Gammaproteobacteria bacterium]|nr:hypothetical protein [Gammaproteobacteria bacterium]MBU1625313.1 hypothetical protein [Gammaproteobacteria bacterium]MBU1981573.1 hypothetical protein [Gammaproteobacteria bacterium]